MERRYLPGVYLTAGAATFAVLVWLTVVSPPSSDVLLPAVLFGGLILFADLFGVPLTAGVVSLLPTSTVAAYLVMGPVTTSWIAFAAALAHILLQVRWAGRLQLPRLTARSAIAATGGANAAAHTASVLIGGAVFQALGGEVPLADVGSQEALALAAFALTYLVINHLVFLPAIIVRGRGPLREYADSLPNLLFYEGSPLVLAPLMALIFSRLGTVFFGVFELTMVVVSLITRRLAYTSERLEQRVQELRGLQAVGQALTASLDIDSVVSAIHQEVGHLMSARNFYVALYEPDVDEVSFPLAIEAGERVQWRTRRTGAGLTEYVLRTRQPLLIRGRVASTLEELGVESIGELASCWLGVPMLAGDEPLGVIALQSYRSSSAYGPSHQRVLATVAAQAAVAIQNARLYASTDEALARRVRELTSILRTAREGIVLLDTDCRTVAVNRALVDLLGVAQLEVEGRPVDTIVGEMSRPFIHLLAYDSEDLMADCEALQAGSGSEEPTRQVVVTLEPSGRHVERTLTPVRTEETISGWLLVLRDVTEEIELERLKDDLTHMLVHDLRSPLTILSNGLTLMEEAFSDRDPELFSTVAEMAQQSSDRMLSLVNALLDVSALESGELTPECDIAHAKELLEEAAAGFLPLARSAGISVDVSVPERLPSLWVDAALIGRVLSNLVDNAIKFAPDGSRVVLWARPDPEDPLANVCLGVSDEGPGIRPEERGALFEKFHQVASVKGRRAGTGLGLPFCKLAVEAHGGRIWVESPSRTTNSGNVGSTFVMMLPTGPGKALAGSPNP